MASADIEASTTELSSGWRIGCAGLPPGMRRERYFENLPYLELDNTFQALPKQKVLKRWDGENHRFGVVAWQGITHPPGADGYPRCSRELTAAELAEAGSYRDTPFVRTAVDHLASAVRAASAEVVLFRTATMWAPSARNHDTLRRFFNDIASAERFGDCQRVWQPDGLWEVEQATTLAAELDILVACDPLPQDPMAPPLEFFAELADRFDGRGYFRLTGMGQWRKLDEHRRELLLALLLHFQLAWLVFETPSKYHDARSIIKELKNRAASVE